ncbi:helix-turn-helix domain-containing protein [Acidimicrobiia bacterium EGI L10123]|uniref:helix-turn-helix domain-containing protein n=1 Tax=Salinilacustrithrix flava TaxID=2957203 RepID=UPI003D7C3362|nr:helix-turn-helix domain-containing protein [Acidimicrobiia bacterium EGI L10123]
MSTATSPRKPSRRRPKYHLIDPTMVRQRRLTLRLSADVLADLLGVSAGAIDHLEHGGEQNHLTIAYIADLARFLGVTPTELLAPPTGIPGGDGDLVDPDDPVTVGRILAEVGVVHADDLAISLNWSTGRTFYALTVLEERLHGVGQRLSWLADSQVAIIHAPGDPAPLAPLTRNTIAAWGVKADEASMIEWVARKGQHRTLGQEINPIVVNRLKAAGILTDTVVHGPRAKRAAAGEEALRFTDDARFNLCLDD